MKLHPDDIEQIAARVVRLLQAESMSLRQPAQGSQVRLVDATTVARRLGVERDWVYAHAAQLGAVRLGGSRGRLRFDLVALRERLGAEDSIPSDPRRGARQAWTGPVSGGSHRLESPKGKKRPGGAGTPPARHREAIDPDA